MKLIISLRLFAVPFLAMLATSSAANAQFLVVNGASFQRDVAVAPGSWVTAFGTFAGLTAAQAATLPIPKTLSGVTINVDGVDAAVHYVSATQINFLIPNATTAGLKPVRITFPGGVQNANVTVTSSAPGVFLKDANTLQGAIINQDLTQNSSVNPARPRQSISIYCAGQGATNPAVADGAAAPRDPLARSVVTPRVQLEGVPVEVQYSGLAPDFVGLWQINVIVPENSLVSGRVRVRVVANDIESQAIVYVSGQ
jgi:uncharacterized protein (TIGR03437 family)